VSRITLPKDLGIGHEAFPRMIYRNSVDAERMVWVREEKPQAADIARAFLRSEQELLWLGRLNVKAADDIQRFLDISAELPITVSRSAAGNILVRAEKANESLMLTGKTAEVLRSYIDDEPVRMADREDMTVRRAPDYSSTNVPRS
jgi:hypothetical protein